MPNIGMSAETLLTEKNTPPSPSEAVLRPRKLSNLAIKAGVLASSISLAITNGGELAQAKNDPAAKNKRTMETIVDTPRALEFVVITDSDLLSDDFAQSNAAAQRIAKIGGNAARIFVPYNKGTWTIGPYYNMLCNAAKAAHDNDLELIISFHGYDEKGNPWMPQNDKGYNQFASTANSIVWALASNADPGQKQAGGCVPELDGINLEVFNEPGTEIAGKETPQQYMALTAKTIEIVTQDINKQTVKTRVRFYIGALAAANHDPVAYLEQMGQAWKAMPTKTLPQLPIVIDIHPYPKNPTDSPADTMATLYPAIQARIDQYFSGAQLMWGEMANGTTPAPSKQGLYKPLVSPNVVISESARLKNIQDVVRVAACQQPSVIAISNFHNKDREGDGNLPSGFFYPDGSPKDIKTNNQVTAAFRQALSGKVAC